MSFLGQGIPQQPPAGAQINRGHPLAAGLVAAYVANLDGGAVLVDLMGIKPGAIPDVSAVFYRQSLRGKALSFPGVSSGSRAVNCGRGGKIDNMWDGVGGTMIFGFIRRGNGGSADNFESISTNILASKTNMGFGGTQKGFSLALGDSNNLNFKHGYEGIGNVDGRWTGTMSLTNGHPHIIGVSYKIGTAEDPAMYQDGLAISVTENATPATDRSSDSGNDLRLGGCFSEKDSRDGGILNGDLYFAFFWAGRYLTPAEHLQFAENPWAIVDYADEEDEVAATAGAGSQTVSGIGNIATAEAFGTAKLNRRISMTGIASAEAFGTAKLNRTVQLTGIASAEAFGTAKLNRSVAFSGIPSGEAFGTLKVNQRVLLTGISSAEAFGTITLSGGLLTVSGIGNIASAEAFGTLKLNRRIHMTGIASAEAFGTMKAASSATIGGIASGEAFGLMKLNRTLPMTGIAGGEAFGTMKLNRTVQLTGIASAEAFGTMKAARGLVLGGIASAEAFGTIHLKRRITFTGIASAEAFGTINLGSPRIYLIGIPSGEAFGTINLAHKITLTGIPTGAAFGTMHLKRFVKGIGAISSAEAFGTPTLKFRVRLLGIGTGEAFGTIHLKRKIVFTGITSAGAFGTMTLSNVALPTKTVSNIGAIASSESFGVPILLGGVSVKTPAGPEFIIELRNRDFNLIRRLEHQAMAVEWGYSRIGGCDQFQITLRRAFDDFGDLGVDFDIQIKLKNPTTKDYDLWYRGFVEGREASLQTPETVKIHGFGYVAQLQRIVINQTYNSTEVSAIVTDILDNYVTPNTKIVKNAAKIEATGVTPDTLQFKNVTADQALRTLADLVGGREFGVDRTRDFFFRARSTNVNRRFVVGKDIVEHTVLDSFSDMVNRVKLEGGEVAGVKYTQTIDDTAAQARFGLREQVVTNSAITTAAVGTAYGQAIMREKGGIARRADIQLRKMHTLYEDTTPIGMAVVRGVLGGTAWGTKKWGTFLWGGELKYQVNSIRYFYDQSGELFATMEVGQPRPDLLESIRNMGVTLDQVRAR